MGAIQAHRWRNLLIRMKDNLIESELVQNPEVQIRWGRLDIPN
jgi:hypothetical protein